MDYWADWELGQVHKAASSAENASAFRHQLCIPDDFLLGCHCGLRPRPKIFVEWQNALPLCCPTLATLAVLRWRGAQKALVDPPHRCLIADLHPRAFTLKHP
jgi:hypothetical protein